MDINKIKNIADEILTPQDLFLVDLKITGDNIIEMFIDSIHGVNIQTCIEVSREIESHLDRDEEDFELTVSSAGIGYPFKVEGQYQKNLNKVVEVKCKDSNLKLTGLLKAFNAEEILLECEEKILPEGSKKKQLVKTEKTIRRDNIKEIRDVVTF